MSGGSDSALDREDQQLLQRVVSRRSGKAKRSSPEADTDKLVGKAFLHATANGTDLALVFAQGETRVGWSLKVARGADTDPLFVQKHWSTEGSRFFHPISKGVQASPCTGLEKSLGILDTFHVELGIQSPNLYEFFLSKGEEFAGQLVVERQPCLGAQQPWIATYIDTKFIPNAVLKGAPMPPLGDSALPEALAKLIPEPFRYWEAKSLEDGIEVREALRLSGLFKQVAMVRVDRTFEPMSTTSYVVGTMKVRPAAPEWTMAKTCSMLGKGMGLVEVFTPEALAKGMPPDHVAYVDAGAAGDGQLAGLVKSLHTYKGMYIVSAFDSAEARALLKELGRPFQFRPGHGVPTDTVKRLFVSSFGAHGDDLRWLDKAEEDDDKPRLYTTPSDDSPDLGKADFNNPEPSDVGRVSPSPPTPPEKPKNPLKDPLKKEEGDAEAVGPPPLTSQEDDPPEWDIAGNPRVRDPAVFKIVKGTTNEEHYVLGIVLEPDVVDAQMDVYSAPEIAAAAHKYMAQYQNRGLMHKTLVNDKVDLLESYVAPCDFSMGSQAIKKGTWMMAVRVKDDELWGAVKRGELTGFSIGGKASRVPDVKAHAKYAARKPGTVKELAFQGIPITVDRPAGFVQTGKDREGKEWTRQYKVDYGFIPATKGGDGEGLDVYLGPDGNSPLAFWVTQVDKSGAFDEYKVILGAKSMAEAKKIYLDHTPEWCFGSIQEGSVHQIKALLGQDPKESMQKRAALLLAEPRNPNP